jgi:hypothetical protein
MLEQDLNIPVVYPVSKGKGFTLFVSQEITFSSPSVVRLRYIFARRKWMNLSDFLGLIAGLQT